MGVSASKDCGCFAVVSNAAYAIWKLKGEETHLSVLDDDDIVPAGLLSEQEIQCLLMDSHSSNASKYEAV